MSKPGGLKKMGALQAYSVANAKNHLPELRRAAISGAEILIVDTRSDQNEPVSLLSTRLLDQLTAQMFPLTVTVLDKPGDALIDSKGQKVGTIDEWSLLIPETGTTGVGRTRSEAEKSLFTALVDYASDFFSDPGFYLNERSGRQHHWGYLRRVLRCGGDVEKLRALVGL